MGIRETLNKNPSITTGVTVAIVILAFCVILWQLGVFGGGSSAPSGAYFTNDDGKTTFVDTFDKIPPFTKDGKEAVGIRMFTCDGGKTLIKGYLEKYAPDAKKTIEESQLKLKQMQEQAKQNKGVIPDDSIQMKIDQARIMGLLVKKPGDAQWVMGRDPKSAGVTDVKCPNGRTDTLEPVYAR